MTTLQFAQPQNSNYQFSPTLDGATYNATITWLFFGQRYYLNVSSLEGELICSVPLIGSPPSLALASLTWGNGFVTAETFTPHGFTPGTVVVLTVSSCIPTAYNGQVDALILNDTEFQYDLAADPGVAVTLGSVAYLINLVGGFFTASSLTYSSETQQITVSP